MGAISNIYYYFSPYTGARERSVALFFKGLNEHSNQTRTRARLGEMLQHDIAAVNLWTEYRYKGYRYLTKSQRKKLYASLDLITQDFDRFYADNRRAAESVIAHIHMLAPHAVVEPEKAVLLQALMDYFSPRRGTYEYRESSSFGRLLRDPSREKLVGDCNQIVTLYSYLYSRYRDVHDLQVNALPQHVALNCGGIDIETTNGTFANYRAQSGSVLLPIEEIASINLLDTTDSYLSTHEVAAEDLLQASRFAFILSHDREVAEHNLAAAYTNTIGMLMERHNYGRALEVAKASNDTVLLGTVGHNGAVYEMERHNYAAARRFAAVAPKGEELTRSLWKAEGAHDYQAHRYHDAVKAFKHAGDDTLVRQCYVALFFEEQDKLGRSMTAGSIKAHAGSVKHMLNYAKKSGNKKLVGHAENLLKYL